MIENIEFWALLISILGGFGAEYWMISGIKSDINKNSQRIEAVNSHAELEFAKCRLHGCKSEV